MSEQQILNINEALGYLKTTGEWRDCQRKKYNVYAILPSAGYVFANRLEQPRSYKYLKERFKTNVVRIEKITDADKKALGNEVYITDGGKVVICGTRGELWTVKPEKFAASYVKADGSPITVDDMPKKWGVFSRMPESAPSAKGLLIRKDIVGKYTADWGVLTINDPASTGHYKGDILVLGQDGSISPINNEVFACTFNQIVGGWANSSLITPAEKIQELTIDKVEAAFPFTSDKTNNTADEDKKKLHVAEVHKQGNNILYYMVYYFGNYERWKKSDLVEFAKDGMGDNVRIQNYQGRDIVRLKDGTYKTFEHIVKTPITVPYSKKMQSAEGDYLVLRGIHKCGNKVLNYVLTRLDIDRNENILDINKVIASRSTYIVDKHNLINKIEKGMLINATIQNYNGQKIIRTIEGTCATIELVEVQPGQKIENSSNSSNSAVQEDKAKTHEERRQELMKKEKEENKLIDKKKKLQ